MKIKKRTKERKGGIPDQRSKGSEKGKEARCFWNNNWPFIVEPEAYISWF